MSWGIMGYPGVSLGNKTDPNDPIKKQRWLLSAGFFSLADFPQKQQEWLTNSK